LRRFDSWLSGWNASRLALAAWGTLGVVLIWLLTQPSTPGNHSWLRRFQTPQVTRGYTIAQRFNMNRPGLHAVAFHPAPHGTAVSGEIRFILRDMTDSDDGRVVRTGRVPAVALADRSSYRFDFEPIADSRHRMYRFEIVATTDHSGVALAATRMPKRYPYDALTVNGRDRWASLLYQTDAVNPTIWSTLWNGRTDSRMPGKLVLALLVANWLLMGVLFRLLARQA
jgi:hypothetical protein